MVSLKFEGVVFLFVTVHIVLANNTTTSNPLTDIATVANNDKHNKLKDGLGKGNYRRKAAKLKDRSTSSSSGEKGTESDKKKRDDKGSSLQMSSEGSSMDSSSDSQEKSSDQIGWRKWHRQCQTCPEAELNWKDKRIRWICGIYQRARRSFKSACLMRYRNCQDGTMFVKLHDYRCKNETANNTNNLPFGDTWFYDYKAAGIYVSDSSKSRSSSSSDSMTSSKSNEQKYNTVEYLYH